MSALTPEQSELGRKSDYNATYDPSKLFAVPRQLKREDIGVKDTQLPFYGFDIWNHYEVSWLNERGKPVVALAEIIYGCDTPNIIESKSMKLYFNSFNNTKIKDVASLQHTIATDISARVGGEVRVNITPLAEFKHSVLKTRLDGINLDDLDIECSIYLVEPSLLETEEGIVEETLCSDLLKSNCLVTGQPDWGSVQIHYKGKKIKHEALLKYIVSFRNHSEFAEHCVERLFMDIQKHCQPESLSVYARFTRRGGLDINPYRSSRNEGFLAINERMSRQ